MNTLYSPYLLHHYHKPSNHGIITQADFVSDLSNVGCGDTICWYGKVKSGLLEQCSFQGSGCIISQATASIVSEYVLGKKVSTLVLLPINETTISLLDIPLGPTRLRCATLSLEALMSGIMPYV